MADGLYKKLGDVVASYGDGSAPLSIDRRLAREVGSPQAFASLARDPSAIRQREGRRRHSPPWLFL